MAEDPCAEFPCPKGKVTVCVFKKKDMGKEKILTTGPDGKDKWFEDTDEFSDYLRKKMCLSTSNRIEALAFVDKRLRSLIEQDTDIKVGVGAFTVGHDSKKKV